MSSSIKIDYLIETLGGSMAKKNKNNKKTKSKVKGNNKIENIFDKLKKGFPVINPISNCIRIYEFIENHTDFLDFL